MTRADFYRLCRTWHGYLSAVAFGALGFFALTGILLNHPDWFPESSGGAQHFETVIAAPDLRAALAAPAPEAALGLLVARDPRVRGAYASGDNLGDEAMLRFEGVRGNTDASVDLATGHVAFDVEKAGVLRAINDLHRGKNAGAIWKAAIDIVGALVLVLSLIGFVLFFSLRFRLATSLALTFGGAAALIAIFLLFVR